MRQHFRKILFSVALILTAVCTIVAPTTANAAEYHQPYRAQRHYLYRRHMRTAKRVGIGAAGGAVAGALIGGGKGAGLELLLGREPVICMTATRNNRDRTDSNPSLEVSA